jgi:prophage DNA circulation protein
MMQTIVNPQRPSEALPQVEAQEYLASLDSLARELDRAMEAVATRSLATFEDSVSRQQAVCARLSSEPGRAVKRRMDAVSEDAAADSAQDAELASRISEATATLMTLNRRYSALLKHSGDTMRLFAGLFRSYAGYTPQGSVGSTQLHTWSCEL